MCQFFFWILFWQLYSQDFSICNSLWKILLFLCCTCNLVHNLCLSRVHVVYCNLNHLLQARITGINLVAGFALFRKTQEITAYQGWPESASLSNTSSWRVSSCTAVEFFNNGQYKVIGLLIVQFGCNRTSEIIHVKLGDHTKGVQIQRKLDKTKFC